MIKNGKYFIPPPDSKSDFKEIFERLTGAGAGRTVGEDGFPSGPWTPELLTEAISMIEINQKGIDLRTVQLWFQSNEKGVSANNIRWLARIFGCDDPVATNDWQTVLSASQSRLKAKRREKRNAPNVDPAKDLPTDTKSSSPTEKNKPVNIKSRRPSLATSLENLMSHQSPLDLPVMVFAGATALGFLAYMLDIHSILYTSHDGIRKQVGFIWAPNWTALFLVFMPIYFMFVTELLVFWRKEGRPLLLAKGKHELINKISNLGESDKDWAVKIEAFSASYWAVLFICFSFVFVFQWFDVCVFPLITGHIGNFAMDWGKIAIVSPELISVPVAIAFTGLSYLFMSLCVFLFYVGLILLYTVAHDFWEIGAAPTFYRSEENRRSTQKLGLKIMCGIFRSTILGLMISICLKLQSTFLQSGGENILDWLVADLFSALGLKEEIGGASKYNILTDFSSVITVLSICAVLFGCSVRIRSVKNVSGSPDKTPNTSEGRFIAQEQVLWRCMTGTAVLLVASYLMIGIFTGFSILLAIGLSVATYSLFDPSFGTKKSM